MTQLRVLRILTPLLVGLQGCLGAPKEVEKVHVNNPLNETPTYAVQPATVRPSLDGAWEGPAWKDVAPLDVSHFSPLGSDHRPRTQAKVVYDDLGLYVHFRVEDNFVRAIETEYHGKVWEDACAEFFVAPKAGRGYFNFEINCGGTMLLSYHEAPDYVPNPGDKAGSVPWELASQVRIFHTMPKTVEPERQDPVTWHLEYFVPYSVFETYVGSIGNPAGQMWRANFYKCAENNSHPHWATWSPIHGKLDFHQPEFFGTIRFEP